MEAFLLVSWFYTWSAPRQDWVIHIERPIVTQSYSECVAKGVKREELYLKYFDGYHQCLPAGSIGMWPVKPKEVSYSVY